MGVASLRIVQVCPYNFDVPGGVQGQVVLIANALCRRGHDVTVVGPTQQPEIAQQLMVEGVSLVALPKVLEIPSNGSIAPISPFFTSAIKTLRTLSAKTADIAHVHEPLVPGPSLAALMGSRPPVIGTFHMAGSSALYALLGPLLCRITSRLGRAVAVSDLAADVASAVCAAPPRVLFNGVDTRRFGEVANDRGRDAARNGAFNVLFVGRHEERKGIRLLLEAAAAIEADRESANAGKRFSFSIAGQGPLTSPLMYRYRSLAGVKWLGSISGERLLDELRSADAICVPSTGGESFGVVLIEAMAAGVPVLASDIPAYRKVAGESVAYFKSGSAESLASALRGLAKNPEILTEKVRSGIKVAEGFSIDRLVDEYEALYEEALEAK